VSYDSSLSTTRDRCRALVGDTDEANELFSDDHYDAVEAQQASFELFVAFIADELIAVYAQEPDRVGLSDGTSVAWTERIGAWKALASRMRGLAALTTAKVTAPISAAVSTRAVW
jgi:hypothetical protein